MNPIERAVRSVDGFQQRHRVLAVPFAVVKKFGDDKAGSLAALLAYYGLLSLFPMLLVLVTIAGLFLKPGTEHRLVHSTVAQFPIIGNQLVSPGGIRALHRRSIVGLAVGIAGLVWGSLGVTQQAQHAMAEVWNVPNVVRPGLAPRLVRGLGLLAVLGLNTVVTTGLAGIASFGRTGAWARVGAAVLAVLANIGLFIVAFRLLTPKEVSTKSIVPGAIAAGLGWSVLQYLGGYLVAHELRQSSQVYGYFASILGLIAFLYLAAQLTLYAAEANVVIQRRLWPRSIVQPPLTDADRETLRLIAEQEERRPEQNVSVRFHRSRE